MRYIPFGFMKNQVNETTNVTFRIDASNQGSPSAIGRGITYSTIRTGTSPIINYPGQNVTLGGFGTTVSFQSTTYPTTPYYDITRLDRSIVKFAGGNLMLATFNIRIYLNGVLLSQYNVDQNVNDCLNDGGRTDNINLPFSLPIGKNDEVLIKWQDVYVGFCV
jgi:hypothetical protein